MVLCVVRIYGFRHTGIGRFKEPSPAASPLSFPFSHDFCTLPPHITPHSSIEPLLASPSLWPPLHPPFPCTISPSCASLIPPFSPPPHLFSPLPSLAPLPPFVVHPCLPSPPLTHSPLPYKSKSRCHFSKSGISLTLPLSNSIFFSLPLLCYLNATNSLSALQLATRTCKVHCKFSGKTVHLYHSVLLPCLSALFPYPLYHQVCAEHIFISSPHISQEKSTN